MGLQLGTPALYHGPMPKRDRKNQEDHNQRLWAMSGPEWEDSTYDEAYGPPSPRPISRRNVDEWSDVPEIEAVVIRIAAQQMASGGFAR